jgi:uncharacterized protein
MYNVGDDTYKKQPKVMSDEVVDAMLIRVREHCLRHNVKSFDFNLHGGEPLLAGPEFFRKLVSKAKAVLLPEIEPIFSMQTNGTLVDDEWCRLFSELNIDIAVSLDGTPEANDMFRIDHAGRGSYERIVKGLKTIMNSPHINYKPSVLSVVNIQSDPVEVYRHFKELGVGGVDFLLPYGNYEMPPFLLHPKDKKPGFTPYADWINAIFDEWFYGKGPKPDIRFFHIIIAAILGVKFSFDYLGSESINILVIETDGGIEPVGSLKLCGNGFTKVGANVLTTEFDETFSNELAQLYNQSHIKLCSKCMNCPVKEICGGGYLPDRYSRANGFNNPSIYCDDLLKIISHIQNRIISEFPKDSLDELGLEMINYDEVKKQRDSFSETGQLAYEAELSMYAQ